MNVTKEYFEKQLKKHDKITVYAPEGIALNISKEFYVVRNGSTPSLTFEADFVDLALYCEHMGLYLDPNND